MRNIGEANTIFGKCEKKNDKLTEIIDNKRRAVVEKFRFYENAKNSGKSINVLMKRRKLLQNMTKTINGRIFKNNICFIHKILFPRKCEKL